MVHMLQLFLDDSGSAHVLWVVFGACVCGVCVLLS